MKKRSGNTRVLKHTLLKFQGPVAVITLNRPEVRNALSPRLMEEVQEALFQVGRRPDIGAVILTGAGSAFCAGADLHRFRDLLDRDAEESRQDSLRFLRFYRTLYEFPRPLIAAVNGPAVGGGCGLATVCDLVVASDTARFGYGEVRVGFVPALVSVFLFRLCSEKVVRELLLTGRTLSAAEAKEVGLVNEVTAPDRLMEAAFELANRICANSPTAVELTKSLLARLPGLSLHQALEEAMAINALARTSSDFREGIEAFLEKRTAVWPPRPEPETETPSP